MRGITYIYYKENGKKECWGIDAHPEKDTSETLEAHLKKWRPDTIFIKADFHDEQNNYLFTYI